MHPDQWHDALQVRIERSQKLGRRSLCKVLYKRVYRAVAGHFERLGAAGGLGGLEEGILHGARPFLNLLGREGRVLGAEPLGLRRQAVLAHLHGHRGQR